MSEAASGGKILDSRLARLAEELVRELSPGFLANHCFRSHARAVALAERDRLGS